MIKKPLLTISIPTYNRAEFLDLCLHNIKLNISSLPKEKRGLVNVYVSDNGSSDGTYNVLMKYEKHLKNRFSFEISKFNKGMDFNFNRCYSNAKTEYVWLISDDDVLVFGGLEKVLDIIINNNIDILYLSNYWFVSSQNELPTQNEFKKVLFYSDPVNFAKNINIMFTYLSGLIVKTHAGEDVRSSCFGSNLVQLSWVLPLLVNGNKFAIIKDIIVAARGNNSGGYNLVDVFGESLCEITNNLLKNNISIARMIQNGAIVNLFPNFIMDFRLKSLRFDDTDIGASLKRVYGNNWRYYFFLSPLIHWPISLANCHHMFIKLIRRIFRSALI